MKGQTVPILVTLWQQINDFALFLEISQQPGFAQLPLSSPLVLVFRPLGVWWDFGWSSKLPRGLNVGPAPSTRVDMNMCVAMWMLSCFYLAEWNLFWSLLILPQQGHGEDGGEGQTETTTALTGHTPPSLLECFCGRKRENASTGHVFHLLLTSIFIGSFVVSSENKAGGENTHWINYY